MKSRFLSHLDEEIQAATNRFSHRCLMAERAAYLARIGEIEVARQDLEGIQRENGTEPHIRVSILINVAEGLCHYYEDMSPKAHDKFLRAHALATASKQGDLQAKASSLMALLEYGSHNFEKMFAHLDEAAESAAAGDNQTLCRVCMIVAQTLHLANKFDLAVPWYMQAKALANEISDDASMSAILYNMASIWLVNRRNCDLGGIVTPDEFRVASVGVSSTWNFDKIAGTGGLGIFTPLMKAQIHSLEAKHKEALGIYESILPTFSLKVLGGWQSWLLADMAWCNLRQGDAVVARAGFERAAEQLREYHHLDDQAATLTRLSEGMVTLGEADSANAYGNRASQAWRSFAKLQNEMGKLAAVFLERRAALLRTRS